MNLSSTLHSLKRSALSIKNRLYSIISDADFVQSVSVAYGLPLVANERCGSWYISPERKVESVYFKSTDGHMNQWSFNLRRLNIQVCGVVEKFGGCVIVDSTRRGKSMPDALSKTVPIWCCVMNRAIFADSAFHELHTSPQAVSASEHAQIERRIDGFVKQFLAICKPDIPSLRRQLQKPFRPLWVIQGSSLPTSPPKFSDFHPIVLCTASRRVNGAEGSERGYIQGAADDHEAWSHGLTPTLFWGNMDILLNTNEEDLPPLIRNLVEEEKKPDATSVLIKPTSNLYISSSENLDISPFDVVISCTPTPLHTTNTEHLKTIRYLHLPLATGKLGSRDLRLQLPRLATFMNSLPPKGHKILVCCTTGKDLSVGVALMLLCLYTNDEGRVSNLALSNKINKSFIKQRLTWITTSSPALNPSRETLKAVNAFLMPDPTNSTKLETIEQLPSRLVLVNKNGEPIQSTPLDDDAPPREEQLRAHIPVTDLPASLPSPLAAQMPNLPSATTDDLKDLASKPVPHISQTLFTSLHNIGHPWTFIRTLNSKLPTHPSGTVKGHASFTPFPNRVDALLYAEQGEFVTDTGLKFTARRKYVYIWNDRTADSEPYISVYFHEDDKPDGIGGLFVEMGPLTCIDEGAENEPGVYEAQNREQHLCGEDLYRASWRIKEGLVNGDIEKINMGVAKGVKGMKNDAWWDVRYDVRGPKKDYVSETRYLKW